MGKTVYTSFSEINELQTNIMRFIDWWVHEKKTPVPRNEVIKYMEKKGMYFTTVRASLYVLLKKGYIREAYTISNKTSYVMLRKV